MNAIRSECFEQDILVRNAWVSQLDTAIKNKLLAIAQPARREIYADIDRRVKADYLATLRELNKTLTVVHIKGYGPVRRSTNLDDLDSVMLGSAKSVLVAQGFVSV